VPAEFRGVRIVLTAPVANRHGLQCSGESPQAKAPIRCQSVDSTREGAVTFTE
jgi:hypothetical protein